MGTKTITMYV
jgi:hypothetical protein